MRIWIIVLFTLLISSCNDFKYATIESGTILKDLNGCVYIVRPWQGMSIYLTYVPDLSESTCKLDKNVKSVAIDGGISLKDLNGCIYITHQWQGMSMFLNFVPEYSESTCKATKPEK